MKKFLLISIMCILLAGDIFCGFFTYKYFNLSSGEQQTNISLLSARELINKVCLNMGFVSSENTNTSPKSVALSIAYENYTEDEIDYNGKTDFIKTFVMAGKFALDGDISEKTYYCSSASRRENSVNINSSMKLFFSLGENSLKMNLLDANLNKEMILEFVYTDNSKTNWKMNIYGTCLFNGQDGCLYSEVVSNNNKIVSFSYCEMKFSSLPSTMDEFSSSNVSNITIFDCNIERHKKLNVSDSDLTSDEIEQYGKVALEKVNNQTSASFSNKFVYKNIDFLARLYNYLGYEVI